MKKYRSMYSIAAIVGLALVVFAIAMGISIGCAWVVSLVWNSAVAATLGAPTVGTWTVWALFWIAGLIGRCFRGEPKR